MDEPNSNLDAAGEEALLRAVETIKKRGATVIVITHRMSILNAVDALLVMRDGLIDVSGPREAVLKHLNDRTAQTAAPRLESQVV
jgi:ATP-binding cassette subfamily C exporter for protease/lipase